MADDIPEYPTRRIRLVPCQVCGRQFNADILAKHQSICRKVTTKKRKVFDAGKQRATDSDVPYKATKQTALVYTGKIRPQDDRSRSKPNWREKHQQLIRSIREARGVTKAMKEGGPLPAFRPSEVPSDYVSCPYCRRNFNEHAAKRHIPFCQSQRERKTTQAPQRGVNQPLNRGRTLPPQNSSQYRQQPNQQSSSGVYSNGQDVYSNGYKHSNSAPMIQRRNPPQELPPPVAPSKSSNGGWSLRKLFGFGSKEEAPPPQQDYYGADDDYDYVPQSRQPPPRQQQVVMRTGRNQENTSLNVRARQRSDDGPSYRTRMGPPSGGPPSGGPSSYGSGRNQYGDSQYKSSRPTAVGRAPASGIRCGDCGSMYTNPGARFCPQCGSRR